MGQITPLTTIKRCFHLRGIKSKLRSLLWGCSEMPNRLAYAEQGMIQTWCRWWNVRLRSPTLLRPGPPKGVISANAPIPDALTPVRPIRTPIKKSPIMGIFMVRAALQLSD